jgi:archaellum component FlaG (FlaF/FlaG flagellin family)
VVALDISKAFDRVWHPALLSKCRSFGLGNFFCNWLQNFLTNRSIQVLVDGFKSNTYIINAGVPQGCVLSPTLFIIFINDLLTSTTNPIHSYADDSTLVANYKYSKKSLATANSVSLNRNKISTSINNDLALIDNWGKLNRVNFNASKTQFCVVSLKKDASTANFPIHFQGNPIERSVSLNVLGMLLTQDFLWTEHVFKKAKSAAKCLGFLWRCKSFFTPADLLKIYKSYIRPKMEYNSHLWAGAPSTTLNYLDKVQNRAIRLIGDTNVTASLAPLGHRRNIGALSLFYKYFVGMDSCSQEIKTILPELKIFTRNTRLASKSHPYFLILRKSSTEYYENSFIVRSSKLWNLLPSNVFPTVDGALCYNLQKFKTNIDKLSNNLTAYPSLIPFFSLP